MTTVKTIKDFLHGIARDGGILNTDGNSYIACDTRLESSDKVKDLYYLAILCLDRVYESSFDPQMRILELRHLDMDADKHILYLENDNAPMYDTLSGIIKWQDQKRFDTWLRKVENDDSMLELVAQLKQQCLINIRGREEKR